VERRKLLHRDRSEDERDDGPAEVLARLDEEAEEDGAD